MPTLKPRFVRPIAVLCITLVALTATAMPGLLTSAASAPTLMAVYDGTSVYFSVSMPGTSMVQLTVRDQAGRLVSIGAPQTLVDGGLTGELPIDQKSISGNLEVTLSNAAGQKMASLTLLNICDKPSTDAVNQDALPDFSLAAQMDSLHNVDYRWTSKTSSDYQVVIYDDQGAVVGVSEPAKQDMMINAIQFAYKPEARSLIAALVDTDRKAVVARKLIPLTCSGDVLTAAHNTDGLPSSNDVSATLFLTSPNLLSFSLNGNVTTPTQLIIYNQDGALVGFSPLYTKINGNVSGTIKLLAAAKVGDLLSTNVAAQVKPGAGNGGLASLNITADVLKAAQTSVAVNVLPNTGNGLAVNGSVDSNLLKGATGNGNTPNVSGGVQIKLP